MGNRKVERLGILQENGVPNCWRLKKGPLSPVGSESSKLHHYPPNFNKATRNLSPPTMSENQVTRWITNQDGIENLTTETVPLPKPSKDEVLVRISAVSLNYRDTEVVMGLYNYYNKQNEPKKPLVPTSDMCGTVVAVGENSQNTPWRVGDRVLSTFLQSHLSGQVNAQHLATGLGKPLDGCLQTYRVFPSSGLVRAPAHMTDEEAGCLAIAAVTAWMAINGMEPIDKIRGQGETVVLQGTGGVSISGLQIAKASGAKSETSALPSSGHVC